MHFVFMPPQRCMSQHLAFLGNLQSEQGPFRRLHLHYFRSDVIARTHLAAELGTPLRHIPFQPVRCDY